MSVSPLPANPNPTQPPPPPLKPIYQADKDDIDKPKAYPSYEELLRESELDVGGEGGPKVSPVGVNRQAGGRAGGRAAGRLIVVVVAVICG